MKRLLSLAFCVTAIAFLLVGVGCEQHPLEQTKARQAEESPDGKSKGH